MNITIMINKLLGVATLTASIIENLPKEIIAIEVMLLCLINIVGEKQ